MNQRVVAHLRPVAVAAFDQRRLRLRPLQDETSLGLVLGERDRLVKQRLVMHDAAGLEPAAGGENDFWRGVVDPRRQFARGEAAEHHRMNGADARAGEHRDRRLRHHRHIKNDAVALADAEIAQHAAEHLCLGQEAMIGDGPLHAGERRIVDDRGLLAAPGIDMAVDGVEAGVADPVRKPAAVDAGLRVEHRLRFLKPVDVGGRFAPKAKRIALPARIDFMIAARTGVHGAALQQFCSIFGLATRDARATCITALAPGGRFDLCHDGPPAHHLNPAVITDPLFYLLAIPAVTLLGLGKGGFAGLGMVATPMLALVVPPLQGAAIILPLLIIQDAISVWT